MIDKNDYKKLKKIVSHPVFQEIRTNFFEYSITKKSFGCTMILYFLNKYQITIQTIKNAEKVQNGYFLNLIYTLNHPMISQTKINEIHKLGWNTDFRNLPEYTDFESIIDPIIEEQLIFDFFDDNNTD